MEATLHAHANGNEYTPMSEADYNAEMARLVSEFVKSRKQMEEQGILVDVHYEECEEFAVHTRTEQATAEVEHYDQVQVCIVRAPKHVIDEMKRLV